MRTKIVAFLGGAGAALVVAGGVLAQPPPALRTGTLDGGDPRLESGESYEEFELEAQAGEEIIVVATSLVFDPYLILISPSDEQHDNDDFGDSKDVSLIEIPVDEPGTWTVRLTTYDAGETGEYALMAATRPADGIDAGGDEAEEFEVLDTIEPGESVAGTLGEGDPVRYDDSLYDAYALEGAEGTRLEITLESDDFNPYLELISPSGEGQSNDDVGEGILSSRIESILDETGRWIVVANTLGSGETGAYRLTVTLR